MPLASAEAVLVAGLAAKFPTAYVSTEAPANLAELLATGPVYRVRRISGSDVTYPYDEATTDIDSWGSNAVAASTAAEAARSYIRTELPGTTHAGAYCNGTTTVLAPVWTPWDNTNVRRYTASYRITLHSTAP